jgi:hypothetical protein
MDEGPAQRAVMAQSTKTGSVMINADEAVWPRDEEGRPLHKISCGAAELIPTVQFGNATIGPVIVTTFVRATTDEELHAEINRVQAICERAVADERQTVAALMRSHIGQRSAA